MKKSASTSGAPADSSSSTPPDLNKHPDAAEDSSDLDEVTVPGAEDSSSDSSDAHSVVDDPSLFAPQFPHAGLMVKQSFPRGRPGKLLLGCVEPRYQSLDNGAWPFGPPTDQGRPDSEQDLLDLCDRIPYFLEDQISLRNRASVAQEASWPLATNETAEKLYSTVAPWKVLSKFLETTLKPQYRFTSRYGTQIPAELLSSWSEYSTHVRQNLQCYWERTYHLLLDAEVVGKSAKDDKELEKKCAERAKTFPKTRSNRFSYWNKYKARWISGLLQLIQQGVVDIDILLDPAFLPLPQNPLLCLPPSADIWEVRRFLEQLNDKHPKRFFYLRHPQLHISQYPAIRDRILDKFPLGGMSRM